MQKKYRVVALSALDLLPLIICILAYPKGGNTTFLVILFSPLIVAANHLLTKENKSLYLCNLALFFSVTIGIITNGILYFKYIYYDSEGVLVVQLMVILAFICIAISSVISIFIRVHKEKSINIIKPKK